MKYDCSFAKINIMLLFAVLILSSCIEKIKISISPRVVEFEANPVEALTINVSANVEWTATIRQEEKWLSIEPLQGTGNATITITAVENGIFDTRKAYIVISGEGVKSDSIRVEQFASIDVAEQIEDENFRNYCLKVYDNAPQDGKISLREAMNVREMIVKSLEIKSLVGLEYFSRIYKLNCSDNEIKNIDFSKNKEIKILDCSFNPLDQINFGELDKLVDLTVYDAGLTSIDVSKNKTLEWLAISNNKITSIDVSNNLELRGLECNYNNLSRLDVSKNTKLQTLYCVNAQLRELDVSRNLDLVYLWCGNNQIATLNVSQNANLQSLSCSNNGIANLNLSNNKKLVDLVCDRNLLTTLDVSQNTLLRNIRCSGRIDDNGNPIGKLTGNIDVSSNILLREFDFQNNPLLAIIYVWQGFDKENPYYRKDGATKFEEK